MNAAFEHRTAKVRVVDTGNLVTVPITSAGKPNVPESFERKWQDIVTLAARIINVPAGLIMRLREHEIEVFASSSTDGNPYEEGERAGLGVGLYCETVVGRRQELLVPHALEDPAWRDNPDVELNMYSYYGVPIRWPDGEVFGTFCALDRKRNEYSVDQRQLIQRLAELVESDLKSILEMSDRLFLADLRTKEIRHRIKNQFNLLISYVDLHRSIGDTNEGPDSLAETIKSRMQTLAKIHDRLTVLEPGARVSLAGCLTELVALLGSSAPFEIEVLVRGDHVVLDERTLVPVASIVNELVINSMKHAFSGVDEPRVEIDIHKSNRIVTLDYRDNGPGSAASGDNVSGLGQIIIQGLAAQLSGTAEQWESGFRLRFPAPGVNA